MSTISLLVDKIEKSEVLEVQERAIGTLHQKASARLVKMDDVLSLRFDLPGVLLAWINKQQGTCTMDALCKSIELLYIISQASAGLILLNEYGAVEFLFEFKKYLSKKSSQSPSMDIPLATIDKILRQLAHQSPGNQNQSFTGLAGTIGDSHLGPLNVESLERSQGDRRNPIEEINMSRTANPRSNAKENNELGINETKDPGDYRLNYSSSYQGTVPRGNYSRSENENYKEVRSALVNTIVANEQPKTHKKSIIDHTDIVRFQLEERSVFLPDVEITESDQKVLFDLTVKLKFGKKDCVMGLLTKELLSVAKEFPLEAFFMKGDLIDTLLHFACGSDSEVKEALFPLFKVFLKKLRQAANLKNTEILICPKTSRESVHSKNENDKMYLEHSYPALEPRKYTKEYHESSHFAKSHELNWTQILYYLCIGTISLLGDAPRDSESSKPPANQESTSENASSPIISQFNALWNGQILPILSLFSIDQESLAFILQKSLEHLLRTIRVTGIDCTKNESGKELLVVYLQIFKTLEKCGGLPLEKFDIVGLEEASNLIYDGVLNFLYDEQQIDAALKIWAVWAPSLLKKYAKIEGVRDSLKISQSIDSFSQGPRIDLSYDEFLELAAKFQRCSKAFGLFGKPGLYFNFYELVLCSVLLDSESSVHFKHESHITKSLLSSLVACLHAASLSDLLGFFNRLRATLSPTTQTIKVASVYKPKSTLAMMSLKENYFFGHLLLMADSEPSLVLPMADLLLAFFSNGGDRKHFSLFHQLIFSMTQKDKRFGCVTQMVFLDDFDSEAEKRRSPASGTRAKWAESEREPGQGHLQMFWNFFCLFSKSRETRQTSFLFFQKAFLGQNPKKALGTMDPLQDIYSSERASLLVRQDDSDGEVLVGDKSPSQISDQMIRLIKIGLNEEETESVRVAALEQIEEIIKKSKGCVQIKDLVGSVGNYSVEGLISLGKHRNQSYLGIGPALCRILQSALVVYRYSADLRKKLLGLSFFIGDLLHVNTAILFIIFANPTSRQIRHSALGLMNLFLFSASQMVETLNVHSSLQEANGALEMLAMESNEDPSPSMKGNFGSGAISVCFLSSVVSQVVLLTESPIVSSEEMISMAKNNTVDPSSLSQLELEYISTLDEEIKGGLNSFTGKRAKNGEIEELARMKEAIFRKIKGGGRERMIDGLKLSSYFLRMVHVQKGFSSKEAIRVLVLEIGEAISLNALTHLLEIPDGSVSDKREVLFRVLDNLKSLLRILDHPGSQMDPRLIKLLTKKIITQEFLQCLLTIFRNCVPDEDFLGAASGCLRMIVKLSYLFCQEKLLVLQQLVDHLFNTLFLQKATTSFSGKRSLLQLLRLLHCYLLTFKESYRAQMDQSLVEIMKDSINEHSKSALIKNTTVGWLLKFIEDRSVLIRCMTWNILLLILRPEVLSFFPTIVDIAAQYSQNSRESFACITLTLLYLNKTTTILLNSAEFNLLNDNTIFEKKNSRAFPGDLNNEEANLSVSCGTVPNKQNFQKIFTVEDFIGVIKLRGVIGYLRELMGRETPAVVVSVVGALLRNTAALDSKNILPIYSQIEIYDAVAQAVSPDFYNLGGVSVRKGIEASLKEEGEELGKSLRGEGEDGQGALKVNEEGSQSQNEEDVKMAMTNCSKFLVFCLSNNKKLADYYTGCTSIVSNAIKALSWLSRRSLSPNGASAARSISNLVHLLSLLCEEKAIACINLAWEKQEIENPLRVLSRLLFSNESESTRISILKLSSALLVSWSKSKELSEESDPERNEKHIETLVLGAWTSYRKVTADMEARKEVGELTHLLRDILIVTSGLIAHSHLAKKAFAQSGFLSRVFSTSTKILSALLFRSENGANPLSETNASMLNEAKDMKGRKKPGNGKRDLTMNSTSLINNSKGIKPSATLGGKNKSQGVQGAVSLSGKTGKDLDGSKQWGSVLNGSVSQVAKNSESVSRLVDAHPEYLSSFLTIIKYFFYSKEARQEETETASLNEDDQAINKKLRELDARFIEFFDKMVMVGLTREEIFSSFTQILRNLHTNPKMGPALLGKLTAEKSTVYSQLIATIAKYSLL